jgi:DNA polymerase eta
VARSRQAPFPFKSEVTVDLIAAAGNKLWRELVGVGGLGAGPIKVNSVQLAFTGLEFGEEGQRNIEGFLTTEKSGKRVREREDGPEGVGSGDDNDDAQRSFVCSRCRKRVSLPHPTVSDQEALEKLKTEHDDFHFARDLVRIKPARAGSDQTQDVLQDKKRRKGKGKAKEGEGEGIAKFFVKLGT